ncbi:MAG: hypothetical protein SOI44_07655 [Lactimicrobium sp.]|jgi:predicted ABC-class ATPase|uniref:hypothetical protein n=1 Tax=Lactimicrobium sp. TaxID=2563780 RepID=UPI002F35E1CA
MDDFEKSLARNLNDPEFKKEWKSLEVEHQIQSALIKACTDAKMTQSDLPSNSGSLQ